MRSQTVRPFSRLLRVPVFLLSLLPWCRLHAQMTTLVAESFGGGTGPLNGAVAAPFAPVITAAGGSATWTAGVSFLANGTVSADAENRSAALNLGSYINATKGSSAGKFELSLTLSPVTGSWISLGFAVENAPSTAKNFTNTGTGASTTGLGTVIYRSNPSSPARELDLFGGPGNTNGIDGPDGNTGSRTLTVTLDLTPGGGYNGSSHHGKVTWSDSVLGNIGTPHVFTTATNFGSILISESGSSSGTISGLTLKQVTVDTAPVVLSLSPSNNSADVAAGINPAVEFTEPVFPGTGAITLWKTAGNHLVESFEVGTSPRITIAGDRLSIDPTAPLETGVTYHLLVAPGAVLDATGNAFGGIGSPTAWSFTIDNTPPIVTGTSPAASSASVSPFSDLVLIFGEAVQPVGAVISILDALDGSLVESIDLSAPGVVSASGNSIFIRRSTALPPNSVFHINIPPGAFVDASGNPFAGLSGPMARSFTTWADAPLIQENFAETGPLQGRPVDTFHPSIGAAGGSAIWAAAPSFTADGLVSTAATQASASLNLGNFINQAAGTANGIFTLSLTLAETSGEWLSLGFATQNVPGTGRNFLNAGSGDPANGVATVIYRSAAASPAGELDLYAGPGNSNPLDGPDGNDGFRTLSVILDLTPAGGYNGSNHFGTVTWLDDAAGVLGGFTFTSARDFGSILISKPSSSGGMIRNLSLRQGNPGATPEFKLGIRSTGPQFDLTWTSRPGRHYDLLSSTDLAAPTATWPVHQGLADMPPSAAVTTVAGVPVTDSKRFFRVNEKDQRPNVVLIMADDLGYGSLGCYGATSGQVSTPNIDQLALSGTRLTSFYSNGPVCSPTRAALLTGRYQQRCEWVPDSDLSPAFRTQRMENLAQRWAWGFGNRELTIAELLQQGGYMTGMVGKWHLGYDLVFHPMNHGFKSFRGFMGGNVDYHTHIAEYGFETLDWWQQRKLQDESGYSTDLITTHAVDFINTHKDAPFFLYVPQAAPHTPLQVRDPNSTASNQAKYREMIQILDQSVGAIVGALDANGIRGNTLVIFCSDNGPQMTFGTWPTAGPFVGAKDSLKEGGIRVPCIVSWPGRVAQGSVVDTPAMTMDFFPTFATLGGVPVPQGHGIDGTHLLPLIEGSNAAPERALHWDSRAEWAVRRGKWKLANGTKLVDLSVDPTESVNLASANPGLVQELTQLHTAWLQQMPAVPGE